VLSSSAVRDEAHGWNGRWNLFNEEMDVLLRIIERNGAGRWTHRGDDMLAEAEIMEYIRDENNQEYIRSLPGAVHGILNEKFVAEALAAFDHDGNHMLDVSEWRSFMVKVQIMRIKFLLLNAFASFRVFFGRAQPWDRANLQGGPEEVLLRAAEPLLAGGTPQTGNAPVLNGNEAEVASMIGAAKARTMQYGRDPDVPPGSYLPPGWWADLVYYSANMHPLHGIFCCDPNNRFSNMERLGIELSAIGFSLATTSLKKSWVIDKHAPVEFLSDKMAFSIIVVTLPSMVIWYSLFFLFTCPCFLADPSTELQERVKRADRFSCIGGTFGWMFLIALMAFLVWTIGWTAEAEFAEDQAGGTLQQLEHMMTGLWEHLHLSTVFLARIFSYCFSWGFMLLVMFNPLIAWGQPDPYGKAVLGDYIGLGQWRIEKQKFQIACLMAATGRNVPRVVEPEEVCCGGARSVKGGGTAGACCHMQ
jgi:hypothetical protein